MTEGMIHGALFVFAWTALVLLHSYPLALGYRGWRSWLKMRQSHRFNRSLKRAARSTMELARAMSEVAPTLDRVVEAWRKAKANHPEESLRA